MEIPGIVYDATTTKEIEDISVEKCSLPIARRVLVLTRADRPVNRSLLGAPLARETLSHEEATGQAEFMDQYLQFRQLPHAAIARDRRMARRGHRTTDPCDPDPPTRGHAPDRKWRSSGRRVVEAPLFVPPVGLFGILTYPEDQPVPRARRQPCSSMSPTSTTSGRTGSGSNCRGNGPLPASARFGWT